MPIGPSDITPCIVIGEIPTEKSFDEVAYLSANSDVRAAVERGETTARAHFRTFGSKEGRKQRRKVDLTDMRRAKMDRLKPFLRSDMNFESCEGKLDFLSEQLRAEARIVSTENVSGHGYDAKLGDMIAARRGGLMLDCGAGQRDVYHADIVNYEIVDYDTTDVMGIGEKLPFVDNTFDLVISVAVLEHVRDPFTCARELSRVLKPGGVLFCSMPLLAPYHGYPHHYFNATHQGIARLFEGDLNVTEVTVIDGTHPIHALSWMLGSWERSLPPKLAKGFRGMTVEQLMRSPAEQVALPYCSALPMEAKLELAAATVLTAVKR